MWIDTHAHLSDRTGDELSELVEEAVAADVGIVVSTGTDISSSRIVITHCDAYPQIWGAAGISPFDVVNLSDTWNDDLGKLLSHPKIIAVGETGIDATNPRYPPPALQRPVFERQLALARDSGLPAVIHSRGAEEEAADLCRDLGVRQALFHCFTGGSAALRRIVENGYYLSISGIITFPQSDLRKLVGAVPPDRLLIETDTPYLAPVPNRGRENRPAWVRITGEEIARLTGKSAEALSMQIADNFRRLFTKFKPGKEPDVD